jgi:hypothetical protein
MKDHVRGDASRQEYPAEHQILGHQNVMVAYVVAILQTNTVLLKDQNNAFRLGMVVEHISVQMVAPHVSMVFVPLIRITTLQTLPKDFMVAVVAQAHL